MTGMATALPCERFKQNTAPLHWLHLGLAGEQAALWSKGSSLFRAHGLVIREQWEENRLPRFTKEGSVGSPGGASVGRQRQR